MSRLNFTNITNENREDFHRLMRTYAKELDENQHRNTAPEVLEKWTDSIIQKQYDRGRCLKLCFDGADLIGFLYGKIDLPDDKGYKKVGYGYIMDFFVLTEHRRMGYGREMLRHLERFFAVNGADHMYLTADPVTGVPFWERMGFVFAGEVSPENGLEIYEKEIRDELINDGDLMFEKELCGFEAAPANSSDAFYICEMYEKSIEELHGGALDEQGYRNFFAEIKEMLTNRDPDEENFLIYFGALPCCWLKVNGLESVDTGWISMLTVEPKFRRRGAGSFAVNFAVDFLAEKGKKIAKIQTTEDNIPALSLYKSCGFSAAESRRAMSGDGTERVYITLEKNLL